MSAVDEAGRKGYVLCPRCGENFYTPYDVETSLGAPPRPALSRADNNTYICSPCGTEEALIGFTGRGIQQPAEWPVR